LEEIFIGIFFLGYEVQTDPKRQMDILYSVDFDGSTLLHLAIDSGIIKVSTRQISLQVVTVPFKNLLLLACCFTALQYLRGIY